MSMSDYQSACVDAMGFTRDAYEWFMNLPSPISYTECRAMVKKIHPGTTDFEQRKILHRLCRRLDIAFRSYTETGDPLVGPDMMGEKARAPKWPMPPVSDAYSVLVRMREAATKEVCIATLAESMGIPQGDACEAFQGAIVTYNMVEVDGLWHGAIRAEHRKIHPKEARYRDGQGVVQRILCAVDSLPYSLYTVPEMRRALYSAMPDDSANAINMGLTTVIRIPKWRNRIHVQYEDGKPMLVGPNRESDA